MNVCLGINSQLPSVGVELFSQTEDVLNSSGGIWFMVDADFF